MIRRLLLPVLVLFTALPLRAALTMDDVAAEALSAGFRGGALVSAIAAADAESALDPDAVGNNVVIVDAAGNVIPGSNGQPQIDIIPTSGRQMLPMGSIHNLSGGRRGKVVSHCRGLWQFNNGIFTVKPTDAQAFDLKGAARCAWLISRHGRDWGKWRVMRNGKAFLEDRLRQARDAAARVDQGVIVRETQRIEGRVTSGYIRTEPGGAAIRRFHRGDSGWVMAGPVLAQMKQGRQVSWKLWWRAEWDTGENGWVAEDLLIASPTMERQAASAVSEGRPHQVFQIGRRPVLTWTIGANTIRHQVRLSTDPDFRNPSDLKWEGRNDQWAVNYDLPWRTRHYWRVDSLGADGQWTKGPVYTFCTEFPPAGYFSMNALTVSPAATQPGCRLQISGSAYCTARQPVLIGASLIKSGQTINDTTHDVPVVINGTTPFSRVFDIPWNATAGTWTVRVALWQDGDEDGRIGAADRVLAELSRTISLTGPLPKVGPVVVTPSQMAPGGRATITATAFPEPGTTLVTARLFRAESPTLPDPGSWSLLATRTLTPAIGEAGGTITFTDVPPSIRRYWYAVSATDQLNRTGPIGAAMFQPGSVLVTIGDTTPPQITWTFPDEGAVIANGSTATGTATDNDSIELFEYSFDGEPWRQSLPGPGGSWSVAIGNNTSGRTGSHRLTIRAIDRSGNVTLSYRVYYIPPAGPADFDEAILFTGNTSPAHWQLTPQAFFPAEAGISQDRLHATGDGASLSFQSFKRPDGSLLHAEAGFRCGPEGAALTWERRFFTPLTVRISRPALAQWQLTAGDSANPQTSTLTIPGGIAPASITVFVIVSDGKLFVRAGRPELPYEIFRQTIVDVPGTFPGDLGTCSFSLTGTDRGPAWLDDISFRAARNADDLPAIRRVRFSNSPRSRGFTGMEWTAFPGRVYMAELDTGTGWMSFADVESTGVVMTGSSVAVSGAPAARMRFRQVVP